MASTRYAFDQAWHDERARLAAQERLWDAGTIDALTAAGVGPGSRVLEAGAGGGSITQWLAHQVGPEGHVLAVDLDTRFVEPLRSSVVEVHTLDLLTAELPRADFDVVHTRLVLEHLADRAGVIDRLIAALRPGGTLVVEDYDWTSFGFAQVDDVGTRAVQGILAFMSSLGFDPVYGRRTATDLAGHGLRDVSGAGRSYLVGPGHPAMAFFSLSFAQLAPAAVQAGQMQESDRLTVMQRFDDNEIQLITPTLFAATGRRG